MFGSQTHTPAGFMNEPRDQYAILPPGVIHGETGAVDVYPGDLLQKLGFRQRRGQACRSIPHVEEE